MLDFLKKILRQTRPPVPPSKRRQRPIPDKIHRYYVPASVMDSTEEVMQRFGEEKRECYVWWGGYITSDGEGQILTAFYPEVKTKYGSVQLNTKDLIKLHSKLREFDQILLVELHTHPGAGIQNEVDAAHPAAIYPGFISIVVSDFAFPYFTDFNNSYVYEYISANQWRRLQLDEVKNRFIIEETCLAT